MSRNAKYIIFAAVIILNLYWVIATPLLPFVDLPFRLAESVIVKNINNPELLFSQFYTIPTLLKSNIFHTYFCSLSYFGDVETANRIYYSIYIIMMPASLFILIKKLKGNTFFSLLSILFVLNHNVHWGFTGYTMSVPVLMILFSLYYDYFGFRHTKSIFLIAVFFILIFFLHFQTALFSLLVFGILNIIYYRKEFIRFVFGFTTMIPVLLLMVNSYTGDPGGNSTFSYLMEYYRNSFLYSLPSRFQILFVLDNSILFEGVAGIFYSAIIASTITIALIFSLIKYSIVEIYSRYKFIILLLIISLACYLLLPDNINGQNVIFERYSVVVLLLIVIFSSLTIEFINIRPLYLIITLVCFAHSLILIDYMHDFKHECSDFNEYIFPAEGGKTMSGIVINRNFRGRNVYAHFPMYYTVWKNGITTGIVDFRFGIIKRKASYEKLPHFIEWHDPNIDYNMHYRYIDYFLYSGNEKLFLDNFQEIKTEGKWILYKNKNNNFSP